jgi:hypothetical protein
VQYAVQFIAKRIMFGIIENLLSKRQVSDLLNPPSLIQPLSNHSASRVKSQGGAAESEQPPPPLVQPLLFIPAVGYLLSAGEKGMVAIYQTIAVFRKNHLYRSL